MANIKKTRNTIMMNANIIANHVSELSVFSSVVPSLYVVMTLYVLAVAMEANRPPNNLVINLEFPLLPFNWLRIIINVGFMFAQI